MASAPFDDDRPYLLPVDGSGDRCADAADQACDVLDRHTVIRQQRYEAGPQSRVPAPRSESGGFGTGTMKGHALRTWPDSPHVITPSANAPFLGIDHEQLERSPRRSWYVSGTPSWQGPAA
jgi:hypothetical protein